MGAEARCVRRAEKGGCEWPGRGPGDIPGVLGGRSGIHVVTYSINLARGFREVASL